jgi:hypothetical protein
LELEDEVTDKAKLLELAERCEKATGPDRELDLAISETLGNCLHDPVVKEVAWSDGTKDLVPVCTKCGAKNAYREWRMFTRSLDAAMTLVPEGATWELTSEGAANVLAPIPGAPGWFTDEPVQASTPALALIAAALRAIAAQQEEAKHETGYGRVSRHRNDPRRP